MNREAMIEALNAHQKEWDILVVGGGASGLGAAVDAASRGYSTLLIEQSDFAKGTSSRSTKLVHGGVRYLQQGDVSLVLEALHERGLLLNNAPHLVHNQSFIIPNYDWWEGPFYTVGMKVYDLMAGKLGLGPSEHLSKEAVLHAIPSLKTEGLCGGVIYHDGQFDDSRLAINLAQTCHENGGVLINYMSCVGLLKNNKGLIEGIKAIDNESGKEYEIQAKVVINATGVWSDNILRMDQPHAEKTIVPSQGIHMVLEKDFLIGNHAIMIPHTDDGRVLFAVPWHNKVVVGTTDTPVEKAELDPRPLPEEIEFILHTASKYLNKKPKKSDVKSVFAGLRPLAAPTGEDKTTKSISRSHKIMVSVNGLISIVGGKWTTYRKMAQDAVDKAIMIAGLEEKTCMTHHLKIHGATENIELNPQLSIYGSDAPHLNEIIRNEKDADVLIHPSLPYIAAEVKWSTRNEMARTIDDVLSRRTRALLLDAQAACEAAPTVAAIMAKELKRDKKWENEQVTRFKMMSEVYMLK